MPSRNIPFVNGEYYHVFNRGVAKMNIFFNFYDHNRFKKTILYYLIEGPKPRFSIFSPTTNSFEKNDRIVELIAYCFMPNHFHFLIKQLKDGGVTEFLGKVSNSYTKYFNTKYKRVGPLFQGEFKAVHISSNEQLLQLSRYIHLNPLLGYVVKSLDDYSWSSYLEYTSFLSNNICTKHVILNQFTSIEQYKEFVLDQESYGKELEFIKHQLLDSGE